MKVGTPVRIKAIRGNVKQYNGFVGQISSVTPSGLVYVCLGRATILFWADELEAIVPVEGGAA